VDALTDSAGKIIFLHVLVVFLRVLCVYIFMVFFYLYLFLYDCIMLLCFLQYITRNKDVCIAINNLA